MCLPKYSELKLTAHLFVQISIVECVVEINEIDLRRISTVRNWQLQFDVELSWTQSSAVSEPISINFRRIVF